MWAGVEGLKGGGVAHGGCLQGVGSPVNSNSDGAAASGQLAFEIQIVAAMIRQRERGNRRVALWLRLQRPGAKHVVRFEHEVPMRGPGSAGRGQVVEDDVARHEWKV